MSDAISTQPTAHDGQTKKKTGAYYLVSFFAGAGVMVVEVTATRLLTPHFGGTLFIWTSAISVILAALAVGYFLGSLLARQDKLELILSRALFFSSLLTLLIPYLVYLLGGYYLGSLYEELRVPALQFVGVLIAALVVLMPAAVTYGLFSPLIIELLGRNGHHPGMVSGRVFAVSTAGSILGTIAGAIFFIPVVGTHITFMCVAALMFLFVFFFDRVRMWHIIGLALVISGFVWRPNPLLRDNVVFYRESPYQTIRLFDEGDHYNLVYNEGLGIQSVMFKDTPYTGTYWDWLAMMPFIREKANQDFLLVGYAGGTIARLWQETPAASRIANVDAVEIDQDVVDLVRARFSADDFGTNLTVDDGRHYLATSDRSYDVIFIDAFGNELQVPFQFTTVEFLSLARVHLRASGIYAINVAVGVKNSQLVEAVLNTVASAFPSVITISGTDTLNILVLASEESINTEQLQEWQALSQAPYQKLSTANVTFNPNIPVLTDDHAPVEWMTEMAILDLF